VTYPYPTQPLSRFEEGIRDRVVLVTGAAGGIGWATCQAFAALGASVAIHHFNERGRAEELSAEIQDHGGTAAVVEADVRSRPEVNLMIATVEDSLGAVEVLVNSAGIALERPFLDTSEEEWETVVATDLTGLFHCCQAAARAMLRRGGGTVVNISSQLAFKGASNTAAYSAAKAGVTGLTRSMAAELGPSIRVNAVAPGPVITPLVEPFDSERWRATKLQGVVAGRLATPGDVVPAIVFLASNASEYFHGQTLHVNGGGVMP
jgi:3-oxoacyl-[acyl-carrier protein] reductase